MLLNGQLRSTKLHSHFQPMAYGMTSSTIEPRVASGNIAVRYQRAIRGGNILILNHPAVGPRSNAAYLRLGGFPGTAPEDPRDQPEPPASSRDLAIHHSPEPRASSSRQPSNTSRSQQSRRPTQLPQPSTEHTNQTYSAQIGRTQLSSQVPTQSGPPQEDRLLTDQRPIREVFT